MSQLRTKLERQFQQARDNLADWTKTLDERGVAPERRRRDSVWRHLNANCSQLAARLRATAAVEQLNDDLKQRKAEKAAAPKAEKTKTKPDKSKKGEKPKKDKQAKQPEQQADKKTQKKPKQQKQSKQ